MNQFLLRIFAAITVVAMVSGCHTLGKRKEAPNTSFNDSAGDSWMVEYNSELLGDQVLYVTPHKSKFETKRQHLNLVMLRAPEEAVFVYWEPKKLMYNGSIASWKAERARSDAETENRFRSETGVVEDTLYEKGNKEQTIAGVPARLFVGKTVIHLRNGKTEEVTMHLWLTDQIKAPSEFFSFVSTAKGLPPDTVPLRISIEQDGKPKILMDTVKAFKMNVPDSVFEIPIGYKTVASEEELVRNMQQDIMERQQALNPQPAGAPSTPPPVQAQKASSPRKGRGDVEEVSRTPSGASGKTKSEAFAGLNDGAEKSKAKAGSAKSETTPTKTDAKPMKPESKPKTEPQTKAAPKQRDKRSEGN